MKRILFISGYYQRMAGANRSFYEYIVNLTRLFNLNIDCRNHFDDKFMVLELSTLCFSE